MDFKKPGGPKYIPFIEYFAKNANQSPDHASSRDDVVKKKEKKLVYSPNNSLQEASASVHSLKRAIFTVTMSSTQILIVNFAACKLLNYNSEELCSMRLLNLVPDRHRHKLKRIRDNLLVDSELGDKKIEKLVEFVSKDGDIIPASIFFKRIEPPQRCLAIVEPIDRRISALTVDGDGIVATCDSEATKIFEYDLTEIIGLHITDLIPGVCLESHGRATYEISYKQRLTGKTKGGHYFPLCVLIKNNIAVPGCWQIVIWVFLNLSGLIILNRELKITNCNYQIMKLLFGATRDKVLNERITNFIPGFPENINPLSRRISNQPDHSDPSSGSGNKSPKTLLMKAHEELENNLKKPDSKSCNDVHHISSGNYKMCKEKSFGDYRRSFKKCNCKRKHSSVESDLNARLSKSEHDIYSAAESNYRVTDDKPASGEKMNTDKNKDKKEISSRGVTSQSKKKNRGRHFDYKHFIVKEGYYSGQGKHWDGNEINIYYKVKVISFGDKLFYCVWISRDPWEINVCPNLPDSVTESSSFISTSTDDDTNRDTSFTEELTQHSSVSVMSQNDELLTKGEYSNNYTNIQQIGKGAFGYVKMAFRHSDGLLVVTKFIKKRKINVQSWVFDPKWNMKIPLEISLLANLKHPNIVEVLDVFYNDSFFQLVMKKHGAGMDLFEFIERKPNSDEQLNSYIFRQLVSAVMYLDTIGVLHRDIKDENVIINEKFQVKLIDFGSATFKSPDKMFSVFYGTVEYCSPEVLQGNKYRGPELEIWALGVTLYVLSFGENPFYDVQETIKGRFSVSIPTSPFLLDLLNKMLDKDIDGRITIARVADHPWILQPVDIDKYKFEDVVHCSAAEADPPRYMREFGLDKKNPNHQNVESDGDRTMTSSNSICSLQTTENTETLDQYEENLQSLGGDTLSDESMFKSSTPVSFSSSTSRDDITKSAASLNRVCDRCHFKGRNKKRFSLDLNALKKLSSSSSKYSDSSFASQRGSSRRHLGGRLDAGLVSNMHEMKLVPKRKARKSHMLGTASSSGGGDRGDRGDRRKPVDDLRERSSSHETEDTNLSTNAEICDTSDCRSVDGEDSESSWDAEYDKLRNIHEYKF